VDVARSRDAPVVLRDVDVVDVRGVVREAAVNIALLDVRVESVVEIAERWVAELLNVGNAIVQRS